MMGEATIPAISLPLRVEDATALPALRVEVHRDATSVLDAWAALEADAGSIYQTRAWLLPWCESLGARAGQKPVFVLARSSDGAPAALLCLGLHRRGPFKVATFLGGRDANFNLPLTPRAYAWTAASVEKLLRDAAKALGEDAPDVFVLTNQPFVWNAIANPLALLPHHASPSDAHGTMLTAGADALFADKLSKDTRKKLRKKEARLAAIGPITYRIAECDADRTVLIDTFLRQKLARFKAKGIRSEFGTVEMKAFIEAASGPPSTSIGLHALYAGSRIVAIYGGAAHNGHWSGMFNSFDADEEIAKTSPADLLLMRVVARACADGATQFDLGIGAARYKSALCDQPIPLFDTVLAVSPLGRAYAAYATVRQRAKRVVKSNPRLWSMVQKLRALGARS